MKKPERVLRSVLAVALLAVWFGQAVSAFAQSGGPTDASATVTLLEGIDSARSQPGHQYRAVLDKPITVSGIPIPKGTPAIVALSRSFAGNIAIWTVQLTGFVVGGAPVAVRGTSPTLPKSFGNVLGAVNSAGHATAAGLRVFLQPEQVVTFALGAVTGVQPMTDQSRTVPMETAQQSGSAMVQDRDEVRFELSGCTKEDTRIECKFFATNLNSTDLELQIFKDYSGGLCGANPGAKTYIVDQLGNSVRVSNIHFANHDSGSYPLTPGIRTSFRLDFEPTDPRATTLVKLNIGGQSGNHKMCSLNVVFNSIPLQAPDATGSGGASGDGLASGSAPSTIGQSVSAPLPPVGTALAALPNSGPSVVRGDRRYTLTTCYRATNNLLCAFDILTLGEVPRKVTYDPGKSYYVEPSGARHGQPYIWWMQDPLLKNITITSSSPGHLLVSFPNMDQSLTQIAVLQLGGNDGADLAVKWTNVAISTPPNLEPPPVNATPGDPANFSVLSAKLGMTGTEALERLELRFGVPTRTQELSYDTIKSPFGKGDSYIYQVHFIDPATKASVMYYFLPDTPNHTFGQREVMVVITYLFPAEKPVDQIAFQDSLLSRYGPPTLPSNLQKGQAPRPDKEAPDDVLITVNITADTLPEFNAFNNLIRNNLDNVWCKLRNSAGEKICTYPIMLAPVYETTEAALKRLSSTSCKPGTACYISLMGSGPTNLPSNSFVLYDLTLMPQIRQALYQQNEEEKKKVTIKPPIY